MAGDQLTLGNLFADGLLWVVGSFFVHGLLVLVLRWTARWYDHVGARLGAESLWYGLKWSVLLLAGSTAFLVLLSPLGGILGPVLSLLLVFVLLLAVGAPVLPLAIGGLHYFVFPGVE